MRALLMMSDTGGGHRAAAEALSVHLQALRPGADVEVVDAIADISPFWRSVTGLYGPMVRHAPWAWGLLYDAFAAGGGPAWHLTQRLVLETVRPRLLDYVARKRPDVVCSVHPLINQGCVAAREAWERERGQRIPFAILVSDPVTFHPAWVEPRADLMFVATAEARDTAVARGMPAERVRLRGFPVHPRFSGASPSRAEVRTELGIPHDAHVVMACGGGEGLRHMVAVVEALLALPQQVHVLAVAGRDADAERALATMREGPSAGRLRSWGFTDRMPALIRAADVVVLKAGPGMLFETMTVGVPLVVADALPGQEEGNVRLVRDAGVGRVALGGPGDVAAAVGGLLDDAEARKAVVERARVVAQPDAARTIARELWELVTP